jgi:tetratricopeptide (TPR) repeat protein
MKYCILLFSSLFLNTAHGQQYRQYDTIADQALALQKLQNALSKDAANPELYNLIAKKMIALQDYESGISICNKSIELLTKNKNNTQLITALYLKGQAQYLLDDKSKAEENWKQGYN